MAKSSKPMVSVIMGVFNVKNNKELKDAVDSILNQTFRDFEFIIWDDGSNEDTKNYLKQIKKMDSRIIIRGQEENKGLAFSLNECLKIAKGRYIARMDSDDISYPNRLKTQVDFLESHKEFSWAGCNADLFDENGIWGERTMPERPTKEDYLRFSPYIHPSVVFRRSIFEQNGGYVVSEETLRCEDYEIFMRLKANGFNGTNIQEKLFCYREDLDSYKRRTLKSRIAEMRCRYNNFKLMGILFPKGWIYVARPILAIFVPRKVISVAKRKSAANNSNSTGAEVVRLYSSQEKAKNSQCIM